MKALELEQFFAVVRVTYVAQSVLTFFSLWTKSFSAFSTRSYSLGAAYYAVMKSLSKGASPTNESY